MKKISLLFLFLFILLFGSNSEVFIDYFDHSQYVQNKNSNDWTFELQKAAYLYFLDKKDFNKISEFYNFIQELGDKKKCGDIEFANPVIIALMDFRYNKYLEELFKVVPEAFSLSDYDGNVRSEAPIIFAIRTNNLNNVRFFFEHNIPIPMTDELFGSFDMGGSRFKFGFNLLTAIDSPNGQDIQDYLVSKGYEEESIPVKNDYYVFGSENVYYAPGFKSKYLDKLLSGTKINVQKYTNYKRNGYQWAKITYGKNKEGWITVTNIRHDVKGGGI